MPLFEYEAHNGNVNYGGSSFICKESEFNRTTDKPNGSQLEVVDDATDSVTRYCLAFEGKWYDR